jgi:hypothetical protein
MTDSNPVAADDDLPWARRKVAEPATARNRRQVADLPAWDPLPPGEIFVRRHARD